MSEIAASFYDLEYFISMEYRYLSGAHGSRVAHIIKAVGDVRGKKLLDMGCGGGFFTNEFQRMGAQVTGIDYSPFAIEFGKSRYPELDLRVHSALESAALGDGIWDIVTLIDVIEHVSDQAHLLQQIHALLKPGGRLIISTDAEETMWNRAPYGRLLRAMERFSADGRAMRLIRRVEATRRKTRNYHSSHIGLLNAQQLRELLQRQGFSVETQSVFPVVGVPLRDVVLRLLPAPFRGDHQVVTARRSA